MRKLIILAALAVVWSSCQHKQTGLTYRTEYITVDSATADATRDMDYVAYMAPIKAFMDSEMGIILGYCADELWIDSTENPMLNWTADVLLKKAQEVCPFKVHISIQNTGGARAPWTIGKLKLGDVFKTMPFNNRMVVLQMKGSTILKLFGNLAPKERAHGIAGIRVAVKHKELVSIEIDGQPVDPDAVYGVATSNYLAKGKDGMLELKTRDTLWDSELLIRDIYIEAIREQDTVHAAVDGRWTIEK